VKRGPLLLALVMVTVGAVASAQNRPQPIPSGDDGNAQAASSTSATRPSHLPPMHYPATAWRYHKHVEFMLGLLQKAVGRAHVTQGDVNKVVLVLKDCAAHAEADGYVTREEGQHCQTVVYEKLHELATPYLIQYAAEH
jgi:hypothetical protein